jgi:enolase
MKIKRVHARQIFDSRGNPTVECDVELENGIIGRAAVPSGASTGAKEAMELRDKDATAYLGLGVLRAVRHVNIVIADKLVGMDSADQQSVDKIMIELDGTENKSNIGANAILSVSLACAKANAQALGIPLYAYVAQIRGNTEFVLPLPQINIINGGKHAGWATDLQEYMILPVGARTFNDALRMSSEIFHMLGKVVTEKGYTSLVGDEGGYSPAVKNGNAEPFELISEAVSRAGYIVGKDIVFGIDAAASEFYKDGKYILKKEGRELTSAEMVDWLIALTEKYPIVSMEDPLDQEDWEGWKMLTERIGSEVQIVGDDLFVTNIKYLARGITEKSANAILIKLNQIGTLTETIDAINMAKNVGWRSVVSHRSGETEDTTIAHLAVGLATGQIKTGSMSRTDRLAKYNELLRIEEELGDKVMFSGFFK